MISDITVEAKLRTRTGSADSRRLRRQGMIPATVYGDKKDPLSVAVDAKQLTLILRSDSGHNTIFKLQPPDQDAAIVMIKDWQIDPVKGKLMHADFYRISLTDKQRVSVPLELVGEPEGVKLDGGILDHPLREIELECLPADIPESIEIDVSALKVGDHIMARDIKVADNIRILTNPDQVIAAVLASRVEEEVVAAPLETETAEPEVIKKGKTEEKEKEKE
jgi:large subunit ribosomal protein L25